MKMSSLYCHLGSALMLAAASLPVCAEDILSKNQMTQAAQFLPAPPDTSDLRFQSDLAQYHWGKSMRQTPRGERAIKDANFDIRFVFKGFSGAVGTELTPETTPKLCRLMTKYCKIASYAARRAKNEYGRKRPYVLFDEPTSVRKEEAYYYPTGSYPSGHDTAGWVIGLLLSEICPERQDTIMSYAWQFGQSRVIVGYHFQSDVDAGRFVASSCVARFHADATFCKEMADAKAEVRHRLETCQKTKPAQ